MTTARRIIADVLALAMILTLIGVLMWPKKPSGWDQFSAFCCGWLAFGRLVAIYRHIYGPKDPA